MTARCRDIIVGQKESRGEKGRHPSMEEDGVPFARAASTGETLQRALLSENHPAPLTY